MYEQMLNQASLKASMWGWAPTGSTSRVLLGGSLPFVQSRFGGLSVGTVPPKIRVSISW